MFANSNFCTYIYLLFSTIFLFFFHFSFRAVHDFLLYVTFGFFTFETVCCCPYIEMKALVFDFGVNGSDNGMSACCKCQCQCQCQCCNNTNGCYSWWIVFIYSTCRKKRGLHQLTSISAVESCWRYFLFSHPVRKLYFPFCFSIFCLAPNIKEFRETKISTPYF